MHNPAHNRSAQRAVTVWLTGFTVALSGALLFAIEMGISKQLLPLMGGAPATWNACLLFFQAMVLCGSLYVLVIGRLSFTRQLIAQGILFSASIFSLPLWMPARVGAGISPGAFSALAALIATSAFVVLSLCTASPVLQNWIHQRGGERNPYALYAASNGGCLLGLIAYPFAIEPDFGLRTQSSAWSLLFVVVAALVIAIGVIHRTTSARSSPSAEMVADPETLPVTSGDRLQWVLLALIPASLLAGTNTTLTTDIAPAPLLWVFPLAAYLLSLMMAFSPAKSRGISGLGGQLTAITLWLLFTFLEPPVPAWLKLALPIAILFFSALVCHRALYQVRPPPARLAEFYIFVALGGVLGTAFNVLIAPEIFVYRAEYPLAILAAVFVRSSGSLSFAVIGQAKRDLALIVALFVGLLLCARLEVLPQLLGQSVVVLLIGLAIAAAAYHFRHTSAGLVLVVCAVLAAAAAAPRREDAVILRQRDFYGDLQVRLSGDGKFISLWHGTTIHGAQERKLRPVPLLYYSQDGPLGQIFRSLDGSRIPKAVAVIGLGTGGASSYALPGQRWTYYEINPAVVEQARPGGAFTFLRDWNPDARIIVGDARLLLRGAPDASYDVIIIDAFNSDAIPVHLLTLEAFQLYLRKLAPGGLIALHISNRYLALDNVANAAVRATATSARIQMWRPANNALATAFAVSSQWVAIARTEQDLGGIASDPRWKALTGKPMRAWTDDFSNIATVFRWRVLTSE